MKATILAMLLAGLVTTAALAEPGLRIIKPPVAPLAQPTGPSWDILATRGQWFQGNTASGVPFSSFRCLEFYDNFTGPAGVGPGTLAIRGQPQNIVFDLISGCIKSFEIVATITNDMPSQEPWQSGANSHGEVLQESNQYVGTMWETRLTGDFAVDPAKGFNYPPGPAVGPYQDVQPHIVATNATELAWYCWAPNQPNPYSPPGDFQVPTWNFGNIPTGASATRLLKFRVDAPGLPPTDPRYIALTQYPDVLLNRSTSLKISNWLSVLAGDPGTPYTDPTAYNSDASVFFNRRPHPGDATGDGRVNVDDLGVLATNYDGIGKTWEQGDFTEDTIVNVDDLGVLASNYDWIDDFGLGGGQVPEPVSLALLAAGALALLRRRRG